VVDVKREDEAAVKKEGGRGEEKGEARLSKQWPVHAKQAQSRAGGEGDAKS
jgi:hypothetical protein